MGRRGPQPGSLGRLKLRGSFHAKRRAEQERLSKDDATVSVEFPLILGQLAIALTEVPRSDMAGIARVSGVSESTLSRFVNGKSNLSGDSVDRLCFTLGLRLVWQRTEGSLDFSYRPADGTIVGSPRGEL